MEAVRECKQAFAAIGLFSFFINMLTLTGALFMLQVYDRVLPSRSIPTLAGLAIIALALFAFLAVLDVLRGRLLVRVGAYLDESLSPKIYDAVVRMPLRSMRQGDGLQPIRDFDQIRGFLSGLGPTALFDLPWLPIYLAICFVFHFWIGFTALVGAIILVGLTVLTEYWVREPLKSAAKHAAHRNSIGEASYRNAEVLSAMGMGARMRERWSSTNAQFIGQQQEASDISGSLGSLSRVLRMILQSALLAVGALLVLYNEATPGVIIAGSILGARAVAPVETAIGNWRQFVNARHSWDRLNRLLAAFVPGPQPLALPAPKSLLAVENVSVAPPGERKIVVQDATFQIKAGSAVGIIGPNAAGKSSLARAIVGVWPVVRGQIRLDGAALDQWSADALGEHVGYLPQDVELFGGTVKQNISRFEPEPKADDIIAAAKSAAVHDMILRLPNGYDTEIGESGFALSAGQRQRIALARALYKNPFLVVLDEANSNLDGEGEAALSHAIASIRRRGGIAVVVALRPKALDECDLAMFVAGGQVKAFGPKADVLSKVLKASAPQTTPST
ncbi:MAG: type I secretion system permease/ATPase [Xanthobacteraceae bacterium]|nr:type I secretion system permease/ATPase [Xanthobacteraceae bacterium]